MRPLDPGRMLDGLFYRPGDPFGLTSGVFGALLIVFLILFAAVGRTRDARLRLLLGFSLYFSYRASGLFTIVLLGSTLIDFDLGRQIQESTTKRARRTRLWLGIALNLAVLGLFRYSHVWATWMEQARAGGLPPWLAGVPIGVSFYTFQKMAYLADVYRKQIRASERVGDFLLYVCFFPRLLAGPIVRWREFDGQLEREAGAADAPPVGDAVALIASGLIKKAVISDYIGINFVDRVFASPALYSGFEGLVAVYGYAIQIYCDFSGYTDMALGVAQLVGIRLPRNFDAPYQSTTVTEFWRRWHMTLSFWLRDYVFSPLSNALSRWIDADRVLGVKTELWIYAIPALVTWLACGVWHGAAWGFVIWGLIHGTAVIIEQVTRWPKRAKRSTTRTWVARVVTFHVVCLAWVFFRADSPAVAVQVLKRILFFFNPAVVLPFVSGYPLVIVLVAGGFVLHFLPVAIKDRIRATVAWLPWPAQSAVLAVIVWLSLQMRAADIQPFIYLRF